jgi:S-adenosyl-L-methionine hydrolase (adenosine-forming)
VSKAPPRVTLLTDFGTADGYVGAMKGVIASITPTAFIDDITHDIAPGDIAGGACCLATSWRFHAAGTVHVCVVDPGVGSARRAVAAAVADQFFVAPDNGLLTHVLLEPGATIVEISERRFVRDTVSRTFHGRDVFAPVAAHLARGSSITDLGPIIRDAVLLPLPTVQISADSVSGEVVHTDRFGNLVTNIDAGQVPDAARVTFPERSNVQVRMVATYAEAEEGELIALIGSVGFLEVAVRNGSAAERLGAGRGMQVRVGRGDDAGRGDVAGRGTRTP